jgi:molybdopterin synthase catalytic subunit
MANPTIVGLQDERFDLNELLDRLLTPETGAVCIFTGAVRGLMERGEPRRTEYLEYQAYQSMAEEKLSQIAVEIRERWPTVIGVAIVQRTGRLLPQQPTVAVVCTAGHRDTGVFEAARYGIDRLKEIVPVWKKEVTAEGEEWVEGDYKPSPGE